jgi:predicted RNA binding protein YcfA (HicA-like mRNA interferase family)
MSPQLPIVSGREAIAALEKIGCRVVRQKGSHMRMRHPDASRRKPVTIPMHRELRTGLLRAVLHDAAIGPAEFSELVRH